jgi:hypothetical protein
MPLQPANPAAGTSVQNRGAGSAAGLLLNGKSLATRTIMKWNDYRSQYADYLDATQSTVVATLAASRVLKRFPRSLPEPLRKEIIDGWRRFAKVLSEAATRAENKEEWSRSVSLGSLGESSLVLLLW